MDPVCCAPASSYGRRFPASVSGSLGAVGLNVGRAGAPWDAENRMTVVEPAHPVDDDVKLEFNYDYMGRRVGKKVSTYSGTTWTVQTDRTQRFVYDGWNVVLVLVIEMGTWLNRMAVSCVLV